MKRYLVVIFLLLFSFNTNSVAQEFKNCDFGGNSLFFYIIDESTNTITQLNKAKGTKTIYKIKEIKNNLIVSEVRPNDNNDADGTELNLDLNTFKVQYKRVQNQGGGWNVYYRTYEGQCENPNSSQASTSSSNAITIFGINIGMDVDSAERILNTKGYNCGPLNQFDKLCMSSGKQIQLSDGLFIFMCNSFGGCAYKADEVRSFFEKELNLKINSRETSAGLIPTPSICGIGSAGDKVCIVNESLTSDVGPSVYLMKHKFGSSGMSLN